MELSFNKKQIETIIQEYYKTKEQREVELTISIGVVRRKEKYIGPTYALNYGLREKLYNSSGDPIYIHSTIETSEVEKLMSIMLEEAGFEIESIDFIIENENNKPVFKKVLVIGEKIDLEHENHI